LPQCGHDREKGGHSQADLSEDFKKFDVGVHGAKLSVDIVIFYKI
jgi:hypothetical protein